MNRVLRALRVPVLVSMILAMVTAPVSAQSPDGLAAIKGYLTEHVDGLVAGSTELQTWANDYYTLAEKYNFNYQEMWDAESATLPATIESGRAIWLDKANLNYEMAEGLVAGVPSLAEFDVWIDAGPSGAEDEAGARDWTLETSDGRSWEKPGNIFHSITEPTLWGTNDEFVGIAVDLDGNGTVDLGEALPDAHVLVAGVDALVDASTQLQSAVTEWEPTLSDAFTALVVMIPTAQEYFEQWRDSPYVTEGDIDQEAFVGTSRLVDVHSIFGGLKLTWDNLAPLVAEQNPELAEQISVDMDEMVTLVADLYEQEQAGTRFTPAQADEYGQELQARGESVAGNITQSAALLGVDLQL